MSGPFGGPPPGPPAPGYGGPPPPGYGRPSWAPAQPAPSKMSSNRIVVAFIGGLLALAVIAGALMFLSEPAPPVAPCAPARPCAPVPSLPPVGSPPPIGTPRPVPSSAVPGASLAPGAPTSDSPPALSGTLYTDSTLGYGFEYDPQTFDLSDSSAGSAVLNGQIVDAQVWVDAKTADTSPAKMIDSELAEIDRFLIARVPDTDTYDALLGPSVGFIPGQGGVWSGTLTSRDGTPIAPGGVTIVASTDGRITVAVVVIVSTPDARQGAETQQHTVRAAADDILKTFHWSVP